MATPYNMYKYLISIQVPIRNLSLISRNIFWLIVGRLASSQFCSIAYCIPIYIVYYVSRFSFFLTLHSSFFLIYLLIIIYVLNKLSTFSKSKTSLRQSELFFISPLLSLFLFWVLLKQPSRHGGTTDTVAGPGRRHKVWGLALNCHAT